MVWATRTKVTTMVREQLGRCPYRSGRAWTGSMVDLSPLTLRYRTKGEEDGFLKHSSERLLRNLSYMCCVAILSSIVLVLFRPVAVSEKYLYIQLFQMMQTLSTGVLAFILLIIIKTPCLINRLGLATRELLVILFAMYLIALIFTSDRYYACKLLGAKIPQEVFTELPPMRSDSFLVTKLTILVSAIHYSLPIRWCMLIATEMMVPMIYGTCILIGSEDPMRSDNFLYSFVFVFVLVLGKRQLELNERLVFSSLINEKVLRMQAEFKLSNAQDSMSMQGDADVTSVAPTVTATEAAFGGLAEASTVGCHIGEVLDIGKREQWLLSADELSLKEGVALGFGGFGMVLSGFFHSSPVAIKIHARAQVSKSLADIGNELRILRKLRHPNIVLFHGACLSLSPYDIALVMEMVQGEAMHKFVKRRPPDRDVMSALIGISRALLYLHTRKPVIVHGDLKPDNVIIERRGDDPHAKLLDFGLSRIMSRFAEKGGGTVLWMAPEVLSRSAPLAPHADVFSVGRVVFYATTVQLPYQGLSKKDALKRCHDGLSWPADMPEIALRCKVLADKCSAFESHDRPSTADMHRALIQCSPEHDATESSIVISEDGFWETVQTARNELLQYKASRDRRQAKKARRPVSEEAPDIAPAEQGCKQNDSSRVSGSGALGYPYFEKTPRKTIRAHLTSTLMTWNFEKKARCGCFLHSALLVLAEAKAECDTLRCTNLQADEATYAQCPGCSLVCQVTEDDAECIHCDYVGQFIRPPREGQLTL
eukprot:TRINITY_DN14891_c0_g2_i1.p1 TRINITY_DN14891_c0_g2~~TRINITY_DN14891_c0_g2_i1.p1  ORF type:complete len:766 (-),score=51.31 TRINITY_DN14891_c0_g2_i1:129-2426(-)